MAAFLGDISAAGAGEAVDYVEKDWKASATASISKSAWQRWPPVQLHKLEVRAVPYPSTNRAMCRLTSEEKIRCIRHCMAASECVRLNARSFGKKSWPSEESS